MQLSPDAVHERLNSHARRIEILEKIQNEQFNALHGIQSTLSQIKWAVIGGGAALAAQEFGLLEALKGVL